MPTLDQAIQDAVQRRLAAERALSDADKKAKRVIQRAEADGRKTLRADEDDEVDRLLDVKRSAKDRITHIDGELSALRAAQGEELELQEQNATTFRTAAGQSTRAYDQVARIGQEARTYRKDQDPNGVQFLWDVTRNFLGSDIEARQRLERHHSEEKVERGQYLTRAVGTGGFTGLVVPQYLTDMYAPAIAAMRPFADICNKHQLPPDGMTVNISRITTSTSVGLQATENTNVSEQDMDDTLLTENVQTAAGQQTLSRQSIERGTGVEDVTMSDLFKRYATSLDSTLINQATTGISALAVSTSYTDGTPTVAEMWPKLFSAQNDLEAAYLGQAMPSHFVMHPRRWNWMTSQVSSTWPSIGSSVTPVQAFGVSLTNQYGTAVRGVLSNGMLVTVDANIPINKGAGTNEDEIYCVAAEELHLWEDPNAPVFIRADQAKAASLGVLLVVYGYFAYSARRYTAGVQKIGGTGLITPTFA